MKLRQQMLFTSFTRKKLHTKVLDTGVKVPDRGLWFRSGKCIIFLEINAYA